MNTSLRLVIVLFFNIISFNLQAQERVNEQKIKIDSIGGIIDEAIGYSFNKYNGQWTERKKDQFGTNSTIGGGGIDFYNFFFTTAKKDGENYYILNINFLDGAYKYPTIKEGFYTINKILSFVFDEESFKNISNYEDGSTRYFEFSTFLSGKEINDNNLKSLQESTNVFLRSMTKRSKYNFQVKRESDDVVRFILPIRIENKLLEKYWGFDKQYFEISVTQFEKLFKFNKITIKEN
jgi:hypothetical protein